MDDPELSERFPETPLKINSQILKEHHSKISFFNKPMTILNKYEVENTFEYY